MKQYTPLPLIKASSGYTLVELLISMMLGLFLLTGVYQVNITHQKSNKLQKALEQTQKTGRFAIDNLSYAVKTAGYSGFYGSLSTGVENLLNTPTDEKWDISIPVSGYNNVASTDKIAGITGFQINTDVLLLKGMSGNLVSVISNTNSDTLIAATTSDFSLGDIVVVSDVDQASIFQASKVNVKASTTTMTLVTGSGTPGNSLLLNNSYNSDSDISKYEVQMFYIKKGRNGSPALFKAILVSNAGVVQMQEEEFASNIKDMQISYGIDTNADQMMDQYNDASAITDWGKLTSINIVLLTNSNKDNVVLESSSFSFDTSLVTFTKDKVASVDADKRLKRVFRTSMPLRN